MVMFKEYIWLLLTQWIIYLGIIPTIYDFVSAYLPDKYQFEINGSYSLSFAIMVFVIANFKIFQRIQEDLKAPRVIVDYDLSTFNICYLEIKNIGNDYAKNISIKFDPNVENINDQPFLLNLIQLAPGKNRRFFFGSFLEDKYLQEFKVVISYTDLAERKQYNDRQIIDIRSFLGTVPQEKESEIVKEMKNAVKCLTNLSDNSKKLNEHLKNGILIRNLNIINISKKEIVDLLKNILLWGNEEDFWLNPYLGDVKILIKTYRDKLLAMEKLDDKEKDILKEINILHKHHFVSGNNSEFDKALSNLKALLLH